MEKLKNIRLKIILIITFVAIVFSITTFFLIKNKFPDIAKKQMINSANSLSEIIISSATEFIENSDTENLEKLLNEALKYNNNFNYIFVLDKNNSVMASTFNTKFPTELILKNPLQKGIKSKITTLKFNDEKITDIVFPVVVSEQTIANIRIGLSFHSINMEVRNITFLYIIISSIVLILSIAIGFWYATFVRVPIKKLQHAEDELIQNQEKFISIMSSMGFGILVLNKNMEVLSLNYATKKWFADKPSDKTKKCFELCNSNTENKNCLFCPAIKTFDDGKIHETITDIHKDNEIYHLRIVSHPTRKSPDGEEQVFVLTEDVTEKIEKEIELAKSEKNYRSLIDSSEVGVYKTNLEGEFIFANPSFLRMFEYESLEELKKVKIKSFYANDEERQIFLNSILKTGKTENYELQVKTKTGKLKYIYINSIVEDNIISGMVNDITKIKLVELELERNETLLESFLNNSPTLVFFKSLDGTYQRINEKFNKLFNISQNEIIGKSDFDIFPKEIAEELRKNDMKVLEAKKQIIVEESIPHDDELHTFLSYKFPLFNENKEMISICGISIDMTDRKKSEEKVAKLFNELKEKNAELEQIIYISSHDLRSPLVNIQGFSKEMKKYIDEITQTIKDTEFEEEKKKNLLSILELDIEEAVLFINSSANKIDELLSGLLKLSRAGRSDLVHRKIDMNLLFRKIIQVYDTKLCEKQITIESNPLPNCHSNILLVNQIFSNIISNSIKYMNPKRQGKISISGKIENNRAIYMINDNGIGIPKKNHDRIFHIFYRMNNRKTKGDGIGLTIVKKLLNKLNGKIWLESEEGSGSTFFVELPIS